MESLLIHAVPLEEVGSVVEDGAEGDCVGYILHQRFGGVCEGQEQGDASMEGRDKSPDGVHVCRRKLPGSYSTVACRTWLFQSVHLGREC